MKWYQNFANILALLAIPAGVLILIFAPPEHQDKGWLLIAYVLGVGSVPLARKIPPGKPSSTAKILFPLFFAAILGLGASACITPQIPPNIAGIMKAVFQRHDDYVQRDETLTPLAKQTYLQDTEILRLYLEKNTQPEGSNNDSSIILHE